MTQTLKDKKVTGRKADAMLAAHVASEIALRLVKPGNEVCVLNILDQTGTVVGRLMCELLFLELFGNRHGSESG